MLYILLFFITNIYELYETSILKTTLKLIRKTINLKEKQCTQFIKFTKLKSLSMPRTIQ